MCADRSDPAYRDRMDYVGEKRKGLHIGGDLVMRLEQLGWDPGPRRR